MSANKITLEALSKYWTIPQDQIRAFTEHADDPLPSDNDQFDFIIANQWFIRYLMSKSVMDAYIISRKELSDLFGFKNERYINELEKSFGLPKEGFNQYNVKKCLDWFIAYKEESHKKEIERIKASKPADDLARKNAVLKQMEIDERHGALIPKEKFAELIFNLLGLFSNGLDALGANMATDLIDKHDIKEIISIVSQQTIKLKNDLSDLSKNFE